MRKIPLVYELLRSPEYRKSSRVGLVLLGLKIHMLAVPGFYALDLPLNFIFMHCVSAPLNQHLHDNSRLFYFN